MHLVELCAGTAAISLELLNAVPITGYLGSKSRYANQIIKLLGLVSIPTKITLNDPGPWGRAWKSLINKRDCGSIIEVLYSWKTKGDDELLMVCKDHFLTNSDEICWVASFLWLQSRVLRNMPVDERWKYKTIQKPHGNIRDPYKGRRVPTINGLIRKIQKLETVNWPDTCILHCDGKSIPPIGNSVVYIDPPYRNSTIQYQHNLTREELIDIALNWHNAGSRVIISEQEPVFTDWYSIQLKTHSQRTFSKKKAEWLTSNQPFC